MYKTPGGRVLRILSQTFLSGLQGMSKRQGAQIKTITQKVYVDRRLSFFKILRVIKYWHRFFRQVMESPSLETPRTQLDCSLDPALVEPALSRTGDNVISRYSFPPWLSCDSVTSFLKFFYMPLVLKIAYTVTSRGYCVLYTAEPYLDFSLSFLTVRVKQKWSVCQCENHSV